MRRLYRSWTSPSPNRRRRTGAGRRGALDVSLSIFVGGCRLILTRLTDLQGVSFSTYFFFFGCNSQGLNLRKNYFKLPYFFLEEGWVLGEFFFFKTNEFEMEKKNHLELFPFTVTQTLRHCDWVRLTKKMNLRRKTHSLQNSWLLT